jgi:hypothetical protein
MEMREKEWQKPRFIDIEMNAEIGGYQGDDPDGNEPVVERVRDESSPSCD